MKLGCIADDFTGATDLGGLLVRAGAEVTLLLGVPDNEQAVDADFVIIALKCRTEPRDQAVAEAEQAARWLLAQGAEQLYWKYCSTFDSTDDGNIGPIAQRLMALTGHSQALYCPAFPENGRSVFKGHLFVGDQLLSESPLKDHPLTPMRDANLVRVLTPQVSEAVGLWQRSEIVTNQPLPSAAHVIADAVEFSDLEAIVQQTWGRVLLTGGSALAMPVPAHLRALGQLGQAQHSAVPAGLEPRAVVLAGSCSAQTRLQIQHYAAPSYRIDPLVLMEQGVEPIWDWFEQQTFDTAPIIFASDDPDGVERVQKAIGREKAGALIEDALAQLAIKMRDVGVARFVIAGGETSGAVAKALSISTLHVGAEICPGVPWTFAQSSGQTLALALKSGNFGGLNFFNDALEALNG